MSRKIIAILGLPGSGKTEAIKYLVEKHNWPKVYFGEVTFDEIKRRGLEINEKNERLVREDLRAIHGSDHYAKKVVEKIEALSDQEVIFVESLYSWEEYMVLKNTFEEALVTIAVHAAPRIRYSRLAHRPVRPLTLEEARTRDYAQIEHLHQGGPIAMADYVVLNETTMENMQQQLDKILQSL